MTVAFAKICVLIFYLFQAAEISLFFNAVLPRRYTKGINLLLSFSYNALIMFAAWFSMLNQEGANTSWTTIIYFFGVLFFYGGKLRTRVAVYAAAFGGMLLIEILLFASAGFIIGGISTLGQYTPSRIYFSLAHTVLTAFLLYFLCVLNKNRVKFFSGRSNYLAVLFLISQGSMILALTKSIISSTWKYEWVYTTVISFCLGVPALILLQRAVPKLIQRVRFEQQLKTTKKLEEIQSAQAVQQALRDEELSLAMEKWQGLISRIICLAEKGSEADLSEISALTFAASASSSKNEEVILTRDYAANAILHAKLSECAQHNIKLNCDVNLPVGTNLSKLHLSSILSNLIDNAIHAVISLPVESRIIELFIGQNGGFLYFRTENPFAESRSSDGQGYGLQILSEIAALYEGEVITGAKSNIFTALVSVKLKYNEAQKALQPA